MIYYGYEPQLNPYQAGSVSRLISITMSRFSLVWIARKDNKELETFLILVLGGTKTRSLRRQLDSLVLDGAKGLDC